MRYRERTSKAVSAWVSASDYTHDGAVVCGLRHVYRGVWGCPAWAAGKPCSYCFLRGTVRGQTELLEGVAWVDSTEWDSAYPSRVQNARAAVAKWLGRSTAEFVLPQRGLGHGDLVFHLKRETEVLNYGEYTDSLGFPPEENPHLAMLLDVFSDPEANPYGHKVLIVTKAGAGEAWMHLSQRKPSPNVILSWSVGNLDMEPHWVAPISRAAVAAAYADDGWRVRLRLDPLDSEDNHSIELSPYEHAKDIAEIPIHQPELITLGTPRHNGGRVMFPDEQRLSIYREAIEGLRDGGYEGPIGLCKETRHIIRQVLGIEPEAMRCNCLP